jgi:hypothetical protein
LYYFVVDAIESAFPVPFRKIFEEGKARPERFQLPNWERPPKPFTSVLYPLGYLPYDESTNEGTAQIFEDMLKHQFGLKTTHDLPNAYE